jgi:hypothetical protein
MAAFSVKPPAVQVGRHKAFPAFSDWPDSAIIRQPGSKTPSRNPESVPDM